MSTTEPVRLSPEVELLPQAELLLEDARRSGDHRRELLALVDLGVVYWRGGDAVRAVTFLEPALAIARELADQPRELDILDNLAMTMLATGQSSRAVKILENVAVAAKLLGLRYQEKVTWEHLAAAYMSLKQGPQAMSALDTALRLARELGDEHHAADLLWSLAILNADINQRDRAVHFSEEAISLYRKQGSPYVGWLTEHLRRFQEGTESRLVNAKPTSAKNSLESLFGNWSVTTSDVAPSQPTPMRSDSGLLRMALSAAKSVSRFFSSGFQTVSKSSYERRLETCTQCEHFTRIRCSLCGCFCSIKAWMPHEDCPAGKWPR